MSKKKQMIWKWVGENEFIPGVPPRDMTDEEVKRRGVEDLVKASPKFKRTAQSDTTGDESSEE